jgi:hypothetical protein
MCHEHTYHSLRSIPGGAYACMAGSRESVDTAVVFVHGWDGDPVDTWKDFQSMIDKRSDLFPEWNRSDAFFFSYSDITKSIDDSAVLLREFIDQVFPIPSPALSSLLPYFRAPQYSKLVLVGHSEGAVVIRAAVAYAGMRWQQGGPRAPILDARLTLFAPAQFGFVPTNWLGAIAALTGIRQIARIAIAFSTPATEMHDKTALIQLKEVTQQLYDADNSVPAFSAHVLFGSDEHVVVRAYYYTDCRHTPEVGKNHKSVCKPRKDYDRPLEFVIGGDCPK